MTEPARPRPRPRQRHAGTMTPRSVAGNSDASSTVGVARRTAPRPQRPAQPAQVVLPRGPSQTEINARNQVELHATTLKYIAMKKDSRPPNTRDAYEPRQKEWREWCLRKRFADGELVTEAKMVAFLDQEGRRPRRADPAEEGRPSRGAGAVGRAGHLFALLGRRCRPLEGAGLDGAEPPPEPPRRTGRPRKRRTRR